MFQLSPVAKKSEKQTGEVFENDGIEIPDYLEEYYWWAYVRPWAVKIFERDWLINLILWGFYPTLRDLVLSAMGPNLFGRTLKITCCYGQLEPKLAAQVKAANGTLDILDVAPEQLKNSYRKLDECEDDLLGSVVNHIHADACDLPMADNSYERSLIFFLPHEQPERLRRKTFEEAFRVTKPGGEVYIVEFGKSKWWHPLRYVWYPVLMVLEPFARDIWTNDMATYLPHGGIGCEIEQKKIFGDFYQCLKIKTPNV